LRRHAAPEEIMTTLTQHAPGTFCWPELATTDQNAARKFYGELFGWTHNDTPIGPDEVYTIFQKKGHDSAALANQQKEEKAAGVPPHWNAYVSVANVDQSAELAKKLGGKVVAGPFDAMEHGRLAFIQDPTGAMFALWQAKNHIGIGIAGETGALTWTELMTPDTTKATTFYTQLLGWKAEPMPMEQGGTYTVFTRPDGTRVAGMMATPDNAKGMPPMWTSYFQADNAAATVEQAKKLGGKALVPATPIPNVGTFAVLADPQGAAFGILQPLPTMR
jgi:hypothetical protein